MLSLLASNVTTYPPSILHAISKKNCLNPSLNIFNSISLLLVNFLEMLQL